MKLLYKRLRALDPGYYLYYVNAGKGNGKWVYIFEATNEHINLLKCTKSECRHPQPIRVESLLEDRKLYKNTLSYDTDSDIFQLTDEEFLMETTEYI